MPLRTIPGESTRYGLISFGPDGQERRDDPDGRDGALSQRLLDFASSDGITNIFVFSHGWMGDVPAAIDQYDRWIRAFDTLSADRQRAEKVFPRFRPMFIGLHWPSLPFGDEEIDATASFAAEESEPQDLREQYLERLGDTSAVRSALEVILDEARRNAAADHLSARAEDAFLNLSQALELSAEGVAGAPDSDREPFDPATAFQAGQFSFDGGGGVFEGVLGLLRLCSYWSMKKRARKIGEGRMHDFIVALQRATAQRKTRIHLMGHSFGCIVTSSILGGSIVGGPLAGPALERPIDSVVLAQGALSLWSYASAIPFDKAGPGYFHKVVQDGRIRGPLVTTQSRYDSAVGKMYPMASHLSAEVAFDLEELPKYGAVGTFGLQGLDDTIRHDASMLAADGEYGFLRSNIYNLEASQFISQGGGSSGAHNDIAGSQVAHAIWQAAFASML